MTLAGRLRSAARKALGLVAVLAALGCVSRARDDVAEARTRYEQCVTAASARACVAEKERMLAAERAYQEGAQRAWACDPAHSDCPTPR